MLFKTSALLALLTLLPAALPAQSSASAGKVYGFFTSWSVYARNYHIPDVPAQNLTHLIYSPANVQGGVVVLADPYADTQLYYPGDSWAVGALRGSFRRMQVLKTQHPHLRTLISIGGAGNSAGFSPAVATAAARATFVQSIVDFVVQYDFDGVDINWEYPGSGSNPSDPQNYTLFMQDLRVALDAKGQTLQRSYEITIDVPPDAPRASQLELSKLAPLVDAMHVMAFDYFVPQTTPGNTRSHHASALFPSLGDPLPAPYSSEYHAAWSIDYYLAQGVPADKLQLGVPFFGRGYAGVSASTQGLFGTYTGPTTSGTWSPGVYDSTDLVSNYVGQNGFVRLWDASARVPRLWNATTGEMISYEDASSIREKIWFAKSRGLGGTMIWELSADRSGLLTQEMATGFGLPSMLSALGQMSVSQPAAFSMQVDAGAAAAGRLYFVLPSLGDPIPGLPLPGGVLPIGLDPFALTMLGFLNTPLFPGSLGLLDASGQASCALRLDLLGTLPPSFAGLQLRCAAWVLDGAAGLAGQPSNAATVRIVAP
jgi:chitinase